MFRQVENKGRYKTAQGYYWHIRDREVDYLFTDSALQEAEKRAGKNPEDIPEIEEPKSFVVGFTCGILTGILFPIATYFAVNLFRGF
jgi:hypothetical protein